MLSRPDEDHELLCELTSEEIEAKGKQLAEAVEARRRAEDEKKAANAIFSKRIEDAQTSACDLKDEILSGKERRPTRCVWRTETDSKGRQMWMLRRADTGELVSSSAVTAADLQTELSLS